MFKARNIPLKAPIKTNINRADNIVLVFAKIDNDIPQTKHIINMTRPRRNNVRAANIKLAITAPTPWAALSHPKPTGPIESTSLPQAARIGHNENPKRTGINVINSMDGSIL